MKHCRTNDHFRSTVHLHPKWILKLSLVSWYFALVLLQVRFVCFLEIVIQSKEIETLFLIHFEYISAYECDQPTANIRDAKCRRFCNAMYQLTGYCFEGPSSNFCICKEKRDWLKEARDRLRREELKQNFRNKLILSHWKSSIWFFWYTPGNIICH